MGDRTMRRTRKKQLIVALAIIVAGAAGSFAFMLHKDRTYVPSPAYERATSGQAEVLVVYYSRTGNTEGAAREIARFFDADLVRIEASRYTRDFAGWRHSASDARSNATEVEISHPEVDPRRYKLVAIGSPVWLFRPAPPLWSFVQGHRFDGAHVVLFNTFNSRFKDDELAEFRQLVEERGATWLEHLYVRRGRIYWQKSPADVRDELRQLLLEHRPTFDTLLKAPKAAASTH
jgi:flavodoxin